MKKIIVLSLLCVLSFSVFAVKKPVLMTYAQEEVFVVLDGVLIGENPKTIKIDFDLAKSLIFFKKGYYSYRVEINPELVFAKMNVDLIKKPLTAEIPQKTLLKPDTLVISSIITNMNSTDIWEIVNKNFIKNNYYIGNSTSLFPEAKNIIQSSRYKLGIEIVSSKQTSNVYTYPRFMMGYVKIRWALLDIKTNEVTFFDETEGGNFVQIDTTKGMVVSDKMRIIMEGAIVEAQMKLLTNPKFISLIEQK